MKKTRLVKIKTWKQMEEDFRLDIFGNVDCENIFTKKMEKNLPKNRVILVEDEVWRNGHIDWVIFDEMIEEEPNPKDYPQYFI